MPKRVRSASPNPKSSSPKARLRALGPGESPEWIETRLREARLRDAQRIITDFYNDRELLPDNASPRALENIHRNRIRTVHSLETLSSRTPYARFRQEVSDNTPLFCLRLQWAERTEVCTKILDGIF